MECLLLTNHMYISIPRRPCMSIVLLYTMHTVLYAPYYTILYTMYYIYYILYCIHNILFFIIFFIYYLYCIHNVVCIILYTLYCMLDVVCRIPLGSKIGEEAWRKVNLNFFTNPPLRKGKTNDNNKKRNRIN